jgi:hypothetical protein
MEKKRVETVEKGRGRCEGLVIIGFSCYAQQCIVKAMLCGLWSNISCRTSCIALSQRFLSVEPLVRESQVFSVKLHPVIEFGRFATWIDNE